jgi:uncharacterized protein
MSSKQKYEELQKVLKGFKKVLVAYSGGVDSTFLLAAAVDTLGAENVVAATAVSETYTGSELKQSKALTKRFGVRHIIVTTSELKNRKFSSNPLDRCFYCKDELFRTLSAINKKYDMVLCDADNYSDRTDFRPGRRAAEKWKIRSPLSEVKMTKDDIRALSKALDLPTWNQPAQACLASRVPYGTPIEPALLNNIARAELLLKKMGFPEVRVRHHGEIVRIEVDGKNIAMVVQSRIRIVQQLKKLGWRYITIDIEGYRTGSMNPLDVARG